MISSLVVRVLTSLQISSTVALTNHYIIISRSTLLGQAAAAFTTTTTSTILMRTPQKSSAIMSSYTATFDESAINKALSLLNSVYGPIDDNNSNVTNFPLPMPSNEAGLCHDGYQRRYLWTDAFGVLAYTSIAEMYEMNHDKEKANMYRHACDKLIRTVHECLGTPRSNTNKDDVMKIDNTCSPTGHVGLRIGKIHSRKITDYGMEYDGQYWHYIDKWLLALARAGHVKEGIDIAKSCFPAFFDVDNGGIRWKLSVDSTAPPSLRHAGPSDDTLVALIVFSILEANRVSDDDYTSNLRNEIKMLKDALIGYKPRVTDDPLGWGLEAMYDQYLMGEPRLKMLASIHRSALHPSHLSLPFRLYGAMIGARVAGEKVAPKEKVDKLVEMSLEYENNAMERDGNEEHSSINRVMLAMCLLCPGVLGKRAGDPTISL
jgi:hypothetical protein